MNSSRNMLICLLVVLGSVWLVQQAPACSVCYGDPTSAATKGINVGIWFLVGVTGCVLAGFGAFMMYLARRARLFHQGKIAATAGN